jgi:hypothetical protein
MDSPMSIFLFDNPIHKGQYWSKDEMELEKNRMQKFNKGDAVKIRLDTTSPYRGKNGIINENPTNDSYGFWYMVKFESKGFKRTFRFVDHDLEATNSQ